MAKLDEIAKLLKVDISHKGKEDAQTGKVTGIKRRVWLDNDLCSNTNQSHPNSQIENSYKKSETNWKQIGNKSESKSETNWEQIGNKFNEAKKNWKQIGNKSESKSETLLETNRKQIGNKSETKQDFSSLVGLQRSILVFLYNECKNARDKLTPPITLEHVASFVKTSGKTVKTTLRRLEKKGCILRKNFKLGRGGWTRYEIPDAMFHMLVHNEIGNKSETNWKQIGNKSESKSESESETTAPSSSSSFNNRSTTTETTINDLDLDIVPLENIGFTKEHLTQITKQGLIEPSLIQQSIYAFAHDLESGSISIKKSPLTYFMGILKRGDPYAPTSSDYVSPSEKARKFYMEKLRQQKEEESVIEKDLMNKAYSTWLKQLPEDERKGIVVEILPDNLKSQWFRYEHSSLEEYYKKTIWPNKRKEAYDQSGLPFSDFFD